MVNRPLPEAPRVRVEDSVVQRALDAIFTPLRAVIQFLQPFVQPQPWRPIDLYSDWARYEAISYGPQYVVDPLGRVELRGQATSAGATSSVVGVLPVGARPPLIEPFSCACYNGAHVFARVAVSPDGTITIVSPAIAAGVIISLSGIRFDTRV